MSVTYERDGPVAIVTIDRPDAKNAIDQATATRLAETVDRFESEDAKVYILTGSKGTFSAGADLKKMDLVEDEDGWLGISRRRVSKPTIAAIEGHCIAGGLELALWCDLRVAADTATFGFFERRFGVPLVDGGTQRLPRIVGTGRALEMILTGQAVAAQQAHEWGLVNRLVTEGKARETAVDLGKTIASFPQDTMLADRAALYDGIGRQLDEGLEIEAEHGREVLETAAAGAQRFASGEGRGGEGVPEE